MAKSTLWHIGDQLTLYYKESDLCKIQVQIKGILTTGGKEEQQLILPLSAVQNLLNLQGKIQAIKVSAHCSRK